MRRFQQALLTAEARPAVSRRRHGRAQEATGFARSPVRSEHEAKVQRHVQKMAAAVGSAEDMTEGLQRRGG